MANQEARIVLPGTERTCAGAAHLRVSADGRQMPSADLKSAG